MVTVTLYCAILFVFLAAASKDLHHTGSYKSLHPHADTYHSNVHAHYMNTKARTVCLFIGM